MPSEAYRVDSPGGKAIAMTDGVDEPGLRSAASVSQKVAVSPTGCGSSEKSNSR